MLNVGEAEPALHYEGPGVLVDGECDDLALQLDVGPGGMWPYPLMPDELVEVWVVAGQDVSGGEWFCRVRAGDRIDELSVLVVAL